MAEARSNGAPRSARVLFDAGAIGGLSDEQLLGRFVGRRDEVAELAFAVLVERHGPMVLRACRAALRDEHDAQDAFQATFPRPLKRCNVRIRKRGVRSFRPIAGQATTSQAIAIAGARVTG